MNIIDDSLNDKEITNKILEGRIICCTPNYILNSPDYVYRYMLSVDDTTIEDYKQQIYIEAQSSSMLYEAYNNQDEPQHHLTILTNHTRPEGNYNVDNYEKYISHYKGELTVSIVLI